MYFSNKKLLYKVFRIEIPNSKDRTRYTYEYIYNVAFE